MKKTMTIDERIMDLDARTELARTLQGIVEGINKYDIRVPDDGMELSDWELDANKKSIRKVEILEEMIYQILD